MLPQHELANSIMCYRWSCFNLWPGVLGVTLMVECVMGKEARDPMLGNNWANRAHIHTRKHLISAATFSVLTAGLITGDGFTDGYFWVFVF